MPNLILYSCKFCRKPFKDYASRNRQYCSEKCKQTAEPPKIQKIGAEVVKNGELMVKVREPPNAYERKARLVLERIEGRRLSKLECRRIRFMNGNRLDCSPANLVLLSPKTELQSLKGQDVVATTKINDVLNANGSYQNWKRQIKLRVCCQPGRNNQVSISIPTDAMKLLDWEAGCRIEVVEFVVSIVDERFKDNTRFMLNYRLSKGEYRDYKLTSNREIKIVASEAEINRLTNGLKKFQATETTYYFKVDAEIQDGEFRLYLGERNKPSVIQEPSTPNIKESSPPNKGGSVTRLLRKILEATYMQTQEIKLLNKNIESLVSIWS